MKISKHILTADEDTLFSTKGEAKSYSALKIIEKLYEKGYLDEYLTPQKPTDGYVNIDKQPTNSREKREKVLQEFKDRKEENKVKGNIEKVEDIKFDYQLKHNKLSLNKLSTTAYIIVFLPTGETTYPFIDKRFDK